MRFEPLQNDVGRYLKCDIWDEENGQSGVVLGSGQVQIPLQTKHRSVRDICTIQKGQQIKDTQNRDNTKIDLGYKSSLCRMWRAKDTKVVIVLSACRREFRVIVVALIFRRLIINRLLLVIDRWIVRVLGLYVTSATVRTCVLNTMAYFRVGAL